MKFLVTTVGTIGDINGFLGIAQTLHQRGHEVVYLTNPRYENVIRKAGVDFAPVGDRNELKAFIDSPDFYRNTVAWKACMQPLFLSPMRDLYQSIVDNHQPGETALVASSWSFGARIANEKLGIPLATIHLETQTVRSVYDTPLMPPPMVVSSWVPRFAKRIQFWVADQFFIDPQLKKQTNDFRSELGLPPVNRFLQEWWHSPDLAIGMYPEWFYPAQPDWPPQMKQTGFSNWDQGGQTEIDDDLREFIEGGDPPVVFFAGSNNINAFRFFQSAVEACSRLNVRGVIITPDESDLPELPDGVRQFAYVPFGYLLASSKAIVHHGGRGTASPAMAAGLPQIITPMTFGQVDFAYRLQDLGVGAVIKPNRVSPDRLTQTLDLMLSSSKVRERCGEIAARFNDTSPLEDTSDLIETLITNRS